MKDVVYRSYGSPDVLACEEIEEPVLKDNEVLIEVRAASVNPIDWHFMRGERLPGICERSAMRPSPNRSLRKVRQI